MTDRKTPWTPGPWRAAPWGDGSSGLEELNVFSDAAETTVVEAVFADDPHLTAAAPEMAETLSGDGILSMADFLEMVADQIKNSSGSSDYMILSLRSRARKSRAALAKAHGESND